MSIIGSRGSAAVRALAARTRTDVDGVYQSAAKRSKGEAALDTVSTSADATTQETIVASTVRAATRTLTDGSAALAQGVALTALAAGVGGPVGPALVTVAKSMLDSIYSSSDKRKISTTFLEAVKTHGSAGEAQFASEVLKSAAPVTSDGTAVTVHNLALAAIGRGVAPSAEKALSAFLLEVQDNIYSTSDKRAIGSSVFETLAASSAPEAAIAKTADAMARQKVSDGTAVAVHKTAAKFVGTPARMSSEELLAGFGREVRAGVYSSSDKRALTEPVLDALATSADPRAAALAGATRAAAVVKLGDASLLQLQANALEQMGKASRDRVDVALARLATSTAEQIYSSEDKRKIANHMLSEIQQRTDDSKLKGTLDWVTGTPGQAKAEARLALLASIVAGRCEIPDLTLKVGSETLTVAIPVLDDTLEPSVRRAGLESSVSQNRGVLRRAETILDRASAEMAPLQQRQRELMTRIATPSTAAAPPPPSRDRIKTLVKIGEVAMFAGGASVLFGAGAAGLAVLLGGIVTVVAGTFIGISRIGQRTRQGGRSAEFAELTRVGEDIRRLEDHVGSVRRLADNAKRAVAVAEGPLDVMRMADAVNQPVVDRTLTVEDEQLVIGGIRVPRRTASESLSEV